MDFVGHQVFKLVLEKYGTLENILSRNENGMNAIHWAARWTNRVALELLFSQLKYCLRDEVSEAQERFEQILNIQDDAGATVLDHMNAIFFDPDDNDETPEFPDELSVRREGTLEAFSMTDRRRAGTACYIMLREIGALHKIELSGFSLEYET